MTTPDGPDGLGGRLALLHPGQLDATQRAVHGELENLVGPESRHDDFIAQLDDGRFIGPFNAMLRVPELTQGFGAWVRTITESSARAGIAADVRQAVILTVAASWGADYEIYAHTSAARIAGLADDAINAILKGEPPASLSATAALAHDLARKLLVSRDVPDDLYDDCIRVFGESGTIAILHLIGQYQLVSSLLVCFRVPVPPAGATSDNRAGADVSVAAGARASGGAAEGLADAHAAAAAATTATATATDGPGRAVVVLRPPGGSVEAVLESIELPPTGPQEVRVRIQAARVNPTDWKSLDRAGPLKESSRMGSETAGVIMEIGTDVGETGFVVGDEVILFPLPGAYASEVVASIGAVLPKPAALTFPQAANLLLVGVTAAEMLHAVPATDARTVLVHAASSACGVSLLQQLAGRGLQILGTCSAGNADLVRSFGAIPIEYGAGLVDRVRAAAPDGVDAAYDCVATDESMQVSAELVADRRRIVSIAEREKSEAHGVRFLDGREPDSFAWRAAQRRRLVEMAAAGALTVPVARTLPMGSVAEAIAVSRAGHPGGKLALIPEQS